MKTMLQKHTQYVLIGLILCLALILRITYLGQTPSGFHADEASFYINAVAIAETGADEDGRNLPLSLHSYIDPKPALYSYLQIPFLSLFENQIFASRLPSALLGAASIYLVFVIVTQLSNKNTALLVSLILTISPWHIIVSRGTQEVISSFFFLLLAVIGLLRLLDTKSQKNEKIKGKHILLYAALFGISAWLSMYLYHSSKVQLPLLTIGLLIVFYHKSKTFLTRSIVVVSILIFAGIASLVVQESGSRISAVGIISDKAPLHRLTEQIFTLHEELPISVVRVFYNKATAYMGALAKEYIAYFNTDFLFLEGGRPQRYIVPDHGLLYLVEIPLLVLGFIFAIQKKRREFWLFLGLAAIAPIPAALTTLETPSVIRSFPMVVATAYFTALGILFVFQQKNKILSYISLLGIISLYSWQVGYFAIQYHVQAYYDEPWYRNSPYTEIAQEVSKIQDQYTEIRVTNDLRPLYAYFAMENLIPISELQINPYSRNLEEYQLGSFVFNRGVCKLGSRESGVLYIAETQCRQKIENPNEFEVVTTITYQDGTPVYELLKITE